MNSTRQNFKKLYLLFFAISILNCGTLLKAELFEDICGDVDEFLQQAYEQSSSEPLDLGLARLTTKLQERFRASDISMSVVGSLNKKYVDRRDFRLNAFTGLIAGDPVVSKIASAIAEFRTSLQSRETNTLAPQDFQQINETVRSLIGRKTITPEMLQDLVGRLRVPFSVRLDRDSNTIIIGPSERSFCARHRGAVCCGTTMAVVVAVIGALAVSTDWCVSLFGEGVCSL